MTVAVAVPEQPLAVVPVTEYVAAVLAERTAVVAPVFQRYVSAPDAVSVTLLPVVAVRLGFAAMLTVGGAFTVRLKALDVKLIDPLTTTE